MAKHFCAVKKWAMNNSTVRGGGWTAIPGPPAVKRKNGREEERLRKNDVVVVAGERGRQKLGCKTDRGREKGKKENSLIRAWKTDREKQR